MPKSLFSSFWGPQSKQSANCRCFCWPSLTACEKYLENTCPMQVRGAEDSERKLEGESRNTKPEALQVTHFNHFLQHFADFINFWNTLSIISVQSVDNRLDLS